MANEPESIRETERQARKLAADASTLMLRHPSSRWILRPIRSVAKWVAAKADAWLKEEGWR